MPNDPVEDLLRMTGGGVATDPVEELLRSTAPAPAIPQPPRLADVRTVDGGPPMMPSSPLAGPMQPARTVNEDGVSDEALLRSMGSRLAPGDAEAVDQVHSPVTQIANPWEPVKQMGQRGGEQLQRGLAAGPLGLLAEGPAGIQRRLSDPMGSMVEQARGMGDVAAGAFNAAGAVPLGLAQGFVQNVLPRGMDPLAPQDPNASFSDRLGVNAQKALASPLTAPGAAIEAAREMGVDPDDAERILAVAGVAIPAAKMGAARLKARYAPTLEKPVVPESGYTRVGGRRPLPPEPLQTRGPAPVDPAVEFADAPLMEAGERVGAPRARIAAVSEPGASGNVSQMVPPPAARVRAQPAAEPPVAAPKPWELGDRDAFRARMEEIMREGVSREDAWNRVIAERTEYGKTLLAEDGAILVDDNGFRRRVVHTRSRRGGPKDRVEIEVLDENGTVIDVERGDPMGVANFRREDAAPVAAPKPVLEQRPAPEPVVQGKPPVVEQPKPATPDVAPATPPVAEAPPAPTVPTEPPLAARMRAAMKDGGPDAALDVYRAAKPEQAQLRAWDHAERLKTDPKARPTWDPAEIVGRMKKEADAADLAAPAETPAPKPRARVRARPGGMMGRRNVGRSEGGMALVADPREALAQVKAKSAVAVEKVKEGIDWADQKTAPITDDVIGAIKRTSPELADRTLDAVSFRDAMDSQAKRRLNEATKGTTKEMRDGIREVISGQRKARTPAEQTLADAVVHEFRTASRTLTEQGHRLHDVKRSTTIRKKLREGTPLSDAEMETLKGWQEDYGPDILQRLTDARSRFQKAVARANKTGITKDAYKEAVAERTSARREYKDIGKKLSMRRLSENWKEFWPQVLKPEIVEALRNMKRDKMTQKQADLVAELMGENSGDGAAVGEFLSAYREPDVAMSNPGTDLPRKVRVPDSWLETDFERVTGKYLSGAYQKAGEQRAFKYVDPKAGKFRGKNRGGDLESLIAQSTDKNTAAKYTLRALGRDPETWGKEGRTISQALSVEGQVTAARLFAGAIDTAIKQTSQTTNTVMAAGVRGWAKGLAKVVENPKAAWKRATDAGVIEPGIDLKGIDVFDQTHTLPARGIRMATKPISVVDKAMRVVNNEAMTHWRKQLGDDMRGGGRRGRNAEATLRDLDLSPTDIEAIRKGQWTKEQDWKFRQLADARIQGSAESVFRQSFLSSPNPIVRIVGRVKNFPIGQARTFYRFAAKPLMRGDVKPMARVLVAGTVAGELIRESIEQFRGPRGVPTLKEAYDEYQRTGKVSLLMDRLMADWEAASFLGISGDAVMAGMDGSDERTSAGRFAAGLVLGPTTDLLVDAGMEFDKANNMNRDYTGEDFRKFLLDAAPAIKKWVDAYETRSDSGKAARIKAISKNDDGLIVPRKGKERLFGQLADRETIFR